jgi:hypothetical protein
VQNLSSAATCGITTNVSCSLGRFFNSTAPELERRQDAIQPDLFLAPAPDPLHGLPVLLPTPCRCGAERALTRPGRGPHALSLRCADCDRHRGWVSQATAKSLAETINQSGRPTEPIPIRTPSMPSVVGDLPERRNRTEQEDHHMVTRQEAFPSRWLSAADFPKPAVFEISETTPETVRGNDGRNVKKLALYFRGQRKALIVNATNFDAISKITGEHDSDNWIGHSIELFATTTEMAGRSTPCIRVRAPGAATTAYQKEGQWPTNLS